jgi:hypothetical protein
VAGLCLGCDSNPVHTYQKHGGSMRQDKALATWTGDKLDIQVLEPK